MDNFREWVSDNLRYIMLICAIAIVFIGIFFGVRAITGRMSAGNSGAENTGAGTAVTGIPAEEIPVRKHLRSRDHPLCRGIDNRPLGLRAEKQLISLAHLIASHTAEASGNLRPGDQCRVLSHPRAAEKNDLCLDSQPEQIPGLQITQTDAETIGVLSGNVHEALEGTGIRERAGSVTHAGQHREFFHENDIHG